ncbi:hypothetical protein ACFPVT_02205 [Corynebacterium choanae]|uniref:Uncharacterized protein n=1 Tax=Corynebacterium choanae TaxID=1862358 RepID=A0A3G6J918_9CORY|nr:hypothetical protein [Corynebacterium choanae]AZA12950.1 hypothetical protein CCHOA_02670 [Corynebacterium choanae]
MRAFQTIRQAIIIVAAVAALGGCVSFKDAPPSFGAVGVRTAENGDWEIHINPCGLSVTGIRFVGANPGDGSPNPQLGVISFDPAIATPTTITPHTLGAGSTVDEPLNLPDAQSPHELMIISPETRKSATGRVPEIALTYAEADAAEPGQLIVGYIAPEGADYPSTRRQVSDEAFLHCKDTYPND